MKGIIGKALLRGKINAAQTVNAAGRMAVGTVRQLGKIPSITKDTIVRDSGRAIKSTLNVASGLVKEDNKNSLLGYRLNKKGLLLAGTLGAGSTIMKETKSYYKEDLRGKQDGYTTRFAPKLGSGYGSFGTQAGATGDLALSLGRRR